MSRRVLCVDADADERAATAAALREAGFAATAAGSLADARPALDADLDCVVTEATLPDGTGPELVADARAANRDVAGILFTDAEYGEVDTGEGEVVEVVYKDRPDARERLVRAVEATLAGRTQADYPLPDDEDERLAALATYDLDDPGTRRALDRLTALAVERFGIEMASVNVIAEDEQRLLSCEGIDLDDRPRGASVCTFTILDDGVTVVEDLRADPRFENVTELHGAFRAYAGAPVRTPAGHAIGTFCVYDDEPRSFTPAELADLERFAAEVAEQFELRRRLAASDRGADVMLGPEEGAGGGNGNGSGSTGR
ncbi:MAG: GAF domain-containing protein [Haloferacaceae archaeon]